MGQLVFSPDAKQDLHDVGIWIAKKSGSWQRADAFLDLIYQTCETLATQPEMGELREEFASGVYRSFSVGNYVIYFRPANGGIHVARVLHGARDHRALL
jgi:toxin ParE1/3/4